jgi:nucleoid DNA-binding protein
MSAEDLDEIITRINTNNEILCNKINESACISSEDHKKLIDNFFDEINNTIDFVYNLIISKQLGG